jgi:hypothetical protein
VFGNDARAAVKLSGVRADDLAVVVLFAIFGALLSVCGIGLVAVGVGMMAEGTGAGVALILCGLPVCYGAYLFGRAAIRLRRELHDRPPNTDEKQARRKSVRGVLGYTAAMIAGAIALPAPGAVRVLMAVSAVLVMPVILARDFEPRKRREPPES